MDELQELAKVLEMKGAVDSRKIASETYSSNNQMPKVLEYLTKMSGFVHYVNDYAWTREPSMVVVMSTVGSNSGVG